jgi:hypothetical protein
MDSFNWRGDESFCDFLKILREDKGVKKAIKPTVREVPATMQPQEKPDIDAEDYGVEDYSDQDLNKQDVKPKSKSQKDPKYAIRQVPDKETENPKMVLKDSTEVKEGIFELLGEVPGISLLDQNAVRAAVRSGKISSDWPSEDQMIDELSKLEDFVDPMRLGSDVDIKQEYLKHVIVPKAIVWDKARECKEDLQKTLYLCNNCCKTFRADEAVCPNCLSNIVEAIGLKLSEKVYLIYGTLRGKEKHLTVDAVNEEEAGAKVKRHWPDFEVQKVVASAGVSEARYGVYFTSEGTGQYIMVPAESQEEAESEIKKRFPRAVIHRVVEESKINEQADWDLTFKYSHDNIHSNPLLDKEGNPWIWARYRVGGKRIRVFSEYQAAWVEKQGAVPVREEPVREEPPKEELGIAPEGSELEEEKGKDETSRKEHLLKKKSGLEKEREKLNTKVKEVEDELKKLGESKIQEQEAEVKPKNYTLAGRGLEELDAKDIATRKGGSVVPDDQNKDKFMVLVKERLIQEKVGEKIVGKTPLGEEVSVPADSFLNALAKGVGEAGFDHWFSEEIRREDKLIFEFISSKAPKIEIIVYGKIREE